MNEKCNPKFVAIPCKLLIKLSDAFEECRNFDPGLLDDTELESIVHTLEKKAMESLGHKWQPPYGIDRSLPE